MASKKVLPLPFRRGLRAAFDEHKIANRGIATITSSNQVFNEVLCRSMADLVDADDRYAARSLSLRRHSLVLDHLRPRRDHHRAADAVVRFSYRQGCAAAARRLSGQRFRSARRCRAREDPARDAQRRDGDAARSSVRSVLRQRRFHAAVRDAGRALHRAHRRSSRLSASYGRTSKRRWAGSTGRAIPIATASSNITAPTKRAWSTRAGRTSTTRSFTPMAR